MPILAYRAKQSTESLGTATLVLNPAASNARSFQSAFGSSSRRVQYVISWATGFEIGFGDFDGGSPGSLTRATVLASSNAGGLVTLPAGTKDVFTAFDPAAHEVVSITGTTTLALADVGNTVVFTGSSAASLNFPAVATVPIGAGFMVLNQGTAALTLDPSGAETVNGSATLVLQAGMAAFVRRVSGAWNAGVFGASAVGLALIGATSAAAAFDAISAAAVSVASAAMTNLGAANSDKVLITGTTTITSFGTVADGRMRQLRFAGALTLTHNATSLILPGGANITTAAGDTALAFSEGSGNWRVVAYQRAAGLPVAQIATANVLGRVTAGTGALEAIPLGNPGAALSLGINRGAEQNTTSGTQIDFTSIPAGVRRITVILESVSFNNTDGASIQLGDSGGIETSGYTGVVGIVTGASTGAGAAQSGGAKVIFDGTAAGDNCSGVIHILNQSGNKWVISGQICRNGSSLQIYNTVAVKTLSDVLDRIRFKVDGASSFDAGAINIMWEF